MDGITIPETPVAPVYIMRCGQCGAEWEGADGGHCPSCGSDETEPRADCAPHRVGMQLSLPF